jgi:hypothetical protein
VGSNENDGPKEETCEFALSYKVDGTLITHNHTEIIAEIWPGDNYAVDKKVYDIWTDEAPTFNFHTSASGQGETSGHVNNWQTDIGTTLLLNDVNLESSGLSFTIIKEAFEVDDLIKISFSGTTTGGKIITDGMICTKIDIKH